MGYLYLALLLSIQTKVQFVCISQNILRHFRNSAKRMNRI